MEKVLGKISRAEFGIEGYQGAEVGLFITLKTSSGSVSVTRSFWSTATDCSGPRYKWSEEDRTKAYADIMRYISELLIKAKVKFVKDLVGVPVEATFNGLMLEDWRILEEVL